jgi:hypothetical protein
MSWRRHTFSNFRRSGVARARTYYSADHSSANVSSC